MCKDINMTHKTNSSRLFLGYLFWFVVGFVNAGFSTTKIGPQPLWNYTHTDRLRHDLLLNYDKFARPAQHYNATMVQFDLTIKHIELNEFKSTLSVNGWLSLIWTDEKLKWNTSDYGGLTELHLAEHELWQPDIFVYNSAITTAMHPYGTSHCIAYDSGLVLWVPPVQFTTYCELNLKYWPLDSQECAIKFGSWTYNGNQINLTLSTNRTEAKLDLLVNNSEWKIVKTSMSRNLVYYSCCEEPYPDITVNLTVSRMGTSYRPTLIAPIFMIMMLTLLTFWLPPQAGEKLILNTCTALVTILYLLYFSQKIPAMGSETPLIVLYYSTCLYITAFATFESVAVIWIARTRHTAPLPWFLKQLLTGKTGQFLALHIYIEQSSLATHRVTAEEMRDHQVTDCDESIIGEENCMIRSSGKHATVQKDWILVAAAIDRCFFVGYCLIFSIVSIVYSV